MQYGITTLLNELATLFRRKYYINGSRAGFIMYMTDAAQNQEDVNNIRQAMKSVKGPGNFRNLFMYSPNGKKTQYVSYKRGAFPGGPS
ncbi:portal vertex protein [Serratia sp. DD3]|nr:portal vertex protein [Serratia sp. DD3]